MRFKEQLNKPDVDVLKIAKAQIMSVRASSDPPNKFDENKDNDPDNDNNDNDQQNSSKFNDYSFNLHFGQYRMSSMHRNENEYSLKLMKPMKPTLVKIPDLSAVSSGSFKFELIDIDDEQNIYDQWDKLQKVLGSNFGAVCNDKNRENSEDKKMDDCNDKNKDKDQDQDTEINEVSI